MATTVQEVLSREAPDIEARKLDLMDLAQERAEVPVNLPQQQVAGFSPDQQTSFDLARSGIGSYQPFLQQGYNTMQQGGGMLGQTGQYQDLATNYAGQYGQSANQLGIAGTAAYDPNMAAAFMNPYTEQVTQNIMSELDRQGSQVRQRNAAAAVQSGAFGGSREGVQRAETDRALQDTKANALAQQYSQNFLQAQQNAQQAFENQQGRTQQAGNISLGVGQLGAQTSLGAGNQGIAAGQAMGQLGVQQGAIGQLQQQLGQQDASFLQQQGALQQQQQQNQLNADYQNQMTQEYEPFQRISWLSDIYSGAPSSQSTLSQQAGASASPLSNAVGTGIAALGAYQGLNNLNLFNGS